MEDLHSVERVRKEEDGQHDGQQLPHRLNGSEDEGAVALDSVEDEELPHRRAHGHDADVVADLGVGADEAGDGEDLEVEQQTERREALPIKSRRSSRCHLCGVCVTRYYDY